MIAQLYVLLVGMLYPAYRALQCTGDSEAYLKWRDYLVVFSLFYASSEILNHFATPFIRGLQVLGVSFMVTFPTKSKSSFDEYCLPLIESMHEGSTKELFTNLGNNIAKLWAK